MPFRRRRAVAGAVLLLAGCTSGAQPADNPVITTTQTLTSSSPAPTYHPVPDRAVAPLPFGASTPKGEVDRRCPYIRTGLNQDNTYGGSGNVADIEGDRIYRTTVLTGLKPVGCRWYFYA